MQILTVLLISIFALSKGQAIAKTPNHLQQVRELYIKPSNDGTTGDLYVAATEESGTTSQWLTQQPVHFLESEPAQQSLNTKRAIVSPHMHYNYRPQQNSEVNTKAACPYAQAIPSPTPAAPIETKTVSPCNGTPVTPQYNPYSYFYPQIMSSYANMANILQDAGVSQENANAAVPQTPVLWPQAFAYPVQYMTLDPNAWTQSLPTSSTVETENINTKA